MHADRLHDDRLPCSYAASQLLVQWPGFVTLHDRTFDLKIVSLARKRCLPCFISAMSSTSKQYLVLRMVLLSVLFHLVRVFLLTYCLVCKHLNHCYLQLTLLIYTAAYHGTQHESALDIPSGTDHSLLTMLCTTQAQVFISTTRHNQHPN